jgi:Holliday junction resolvasome RuvABC ATP-dependent DNA helicase subunit
MIESSKKQENLRIISSEEKMLDKTNLTNQLRPTTLEEYVGQEAIKKHLSVAITSSKMR